MTEPGTIIRLAAKGDGVTQDGRFVSGAAPGDTLGSDGAFQRGPHYVEPPCRHFARCGGCSLQYCDEDALRDFVTSRVVNAAEGQGIAVGALLPTHLSPPKSRRRATLHAMRTGRGSVIGFKQARSHKLVDLAECHVLDPALFALVGPLRRLVARHGGKGVIDIALTLTDQGIDCSIGNWQLEGLEATEAILEFASEQSLARLSVDLGYGTEAMWEPEKVTITLGDVAVPFPSGTFLQATADAEAVMRSDVQTMLAGATRVADLFSGLGTFAFAFGRKAEVVAAEGARDAHLACALAAKARQLPVTAQHRDLFRNPLDAGELSDFDAVVLDPPRAGAREQIDRSGQSDLARVAYVSCNPSSWAKDAKRLVEAGFALDQLRPVGQFRWSTHVELVSYFTR